MYEIISVGTSGTGERLLLKLRTPEGEETLSVSCDGYRKLKLEKGEISSAQYMGLKRVNFREAAISKGLSVLGYGMNSKRQLYAKLVRSGIRRADAEAAITELERRGYINECDDARRIVDELVRKQYGRGRIISALRSKGYSDAAVECAEAELETMDFSELCASAARKRIKTPPSDRKEAQKAIAKLVALGYNVGEAKYALQSLLSEGRE